MSDAFAPIQDGTATKRKTPLDPNDPNAPASDTLEAGQTAPVDAPPPSDAQPAQTAAAPAPVNDAQFAQVVAQNQANAAQPAAPTQTYQPQVQPDAAFSDPFASMGGGVQLPGGGWVPKDHPLAQTVGATSYTGGQGSTVAAPTLATGQAVTATPATVQSAYQQQLLNLLNPTPITAQSVDQNPASAAYRLGADRAYGQSRQNAAERAAYEGTSNSGGFDSQLRGLDQQRAEGIANYEGNLGLHLYDQQRQELTGAIQQAQAAGQFQQSQALQEKLAELNAQIQRESLAQSGTIANNSLGYNYTALQEQSNRDALLALLQGLGA